MTLLTANNQRNLIPATHFCHSMHDPQSSPMPHVTPPGFEPRPPARLPSILTTRLWLTCPTRCSKKLIHDIQMVRVSRSNFKTIFLF